MTPHGVIRCREPGYYLPSTHTFLIKAANFANAYSWSHSEEDPAEYREKKCLEMAEPGVRNPKGKAKKEKSSLKKKRRSKA